MVNSILVNYYEQKGWNLLENMIQKMTSPVSRQLVAKAALKQAHSLESEILASSLDSTQGRDRQWEWVG